MTFDTELYNGNLEEPPEKFIKKVHMSGDEWRSLKASIRKFKEGWVRHANAARNIRPARSSAGYSLVSIKPTSKGLRIELETPYRIDAFHYDQVKQLLSVDAQKLATELGYRYILPGGDTPNGYDLLGVKVIGTRAYEYYRITGIATKAPRISFFEKMEAEDEN